MKTNSETIKKKIIRHNELKEKYETKLNNSLKAYYNQIVNESFNIKNGDIVSVHAYMPGIHHTEASGFKPYKEDFTFTGIYNGSPCYVSLSDNIGSFDKNKLLLSFTALTKKGKPSKVYGYRVYIKDIIEIKKLN